MLSLTLGKLSLKTQLVLRESPYSLSIAMQILRRLSLQKELA